MELDPAERQILRLLQGDGRLSNVALAERVGLSESPCFRRVKRLEEAGLIRGYAAVVDQRLLGFTVTAFVLVTMEKQPDAATEAFIAEVEAEEHIVECYATSGSHDYLMKVVARNIDHFSELCMQRILKFPGVMHVESSFSLKEIKHSRVLPA
ncbi:MAG: AsnC family transcriptional regulator [Gammaproteobacteria bacterium]|nr:AsnC family transcriptional regulator [Gammaproteobacteria bacterium]|tara:strand:- start:1718 stop:2176 length:459 start_codon:yes stop_codon:yes gene_type:complete